MERLLAHPPSLPLVHVDHSHRAPAPARTGKCLSVSNPSRVRAEYVVETTDFKNTFKYEKRVEYELSELVCGTTQPKASMDTAKRATENIVSIATQDAKRLNQWVVLYTAAGKSTEDLLMYVGKLGTRFDNYTQDQLEKMVQKHLTEHWSEEDGPKFLIRVDSSAAAVYGEG